MNSRASQIKSIRPQISNSTLNDSMSKDERFQNMVLRPIIELQDNLFIEVFRNYITKHKSVFYDLSLEKRLHYIENAIQKDMKLRNSMKGMIIGLFSVDEYLEYITNSSALNKRMMNLVKERLLSQVQLFEKPEYLKAV